MSSTAPPSSDRVWLLRLYYGVTFFSFGVFLPFLPEWLGARGIDGFGLGVISALRPFAAVISPVLFGIVADRFSLRASLLRIACLGAALSMVVPAAFGFATGAVPVPAVFLSMAVFSFFRAPMVSIADVSSLEGRKTGYGTVRLFGSIGFLVSALLGGFWLNTASASAFPTFIALTMLVAFLIAFALPSKLPTPLTRLPGETRRFLRTKSFAVLLAVIFLWLASHAAYDLCLTLHLRRLGASGPVIGVFWTVGTAFEILLMARGRALFRRFHPVHVLRFSLAVMAARWVGAALLTDIGFLLLLQPLHALSFGAVWLAGLETVRRLAPPNLLATAQGLFSAAAAVGGGLSMLAWGPLYTAQGGETVFAAAAAVGAVATAVCFRLKATEPVDGRR